MRQFLLPCVADFAPAGRRANGLPSAAPILAQYDAASGCSNHARGNAAVLTASPAWQVADVAPPLRSRPFDPSAAADPSADPVAAQWPSGPDDPRMQGTANTKARRRRLRGRAHRRIRRQTMPAPLREVARLKHRWEMQTSPARRATAAARNPAPAGDSSTPAGNLPASIATQPGGIRRPGCRRHAL